MIKYPRFINMFRCGMLLMEANGFNAFWILLLWLLPAGFVHAGCRWMAADRTIWITDYPAGAPCSLTIAPAPGPDEWLGVVAYDAASDVYTVNASLLITPMPAPQRISRSDRRRISPKPWY